MKTNKFESLLGGPQAAHLSPDAMSGLNALALRFADQSEEEALFETAVRHANDDELRKLARFRLDAASSKHLD
ncbi:hypothetical protein [Pelagicoccus sp. SDUM812003]|uniref:hypothetical protein n=1 Tax=Pelagicoccus sp. SDUM812003 TaxID=3041267 RepID=UPI00280FFF20|nr:hypothetical protein [Pelagicoccus sp. SDUM812003]MDQ8205572.1 hypothetical protein [Pelagicoccus sp. SDUM812003]